MKTEALWKTERQTITDDGEDPVIQLLKIRGIDDPYEFLRITKKRLHNPYKMRDMKRAVNRIIDAIKNGLKIRIYGDYDADGVSSTSLWVLVLRELGADVDYYIPDRFKDGYGVNIAALDQAADDGVDLIITCDTGITAIKQIAHAKKLGMDIIVTDHHEPQPPKVYDMLTQSLGQVVTGHEGSFLIPDTIVVNPKRPDCRYPFKSLAGVGVSFKMLCAIAEKMHTFGRAIVYEHMDIVALGTFADVMEVVDENRVIGRLGLKIMNGKKKKRGLYQLMRANEIHQNLITSQDVGWTLAPCINAAGRIISAAGAVEMLIADNKLDSYRYAKKLVRINKERKELTKTYVKEIIEDIELKQMANPTAMIVHYHPEVPEGIIGLIAGRIMNHFYKPVILLSDSEHDDIIKGSGRSISAFDLFNGLMPYSNMMEAFGGHKAACGLSIKRENFKQLKETLEFYADSILTAQDLQPKVYIDCVIDGSMLDIDFVEDIMRMEPFGNANRKPVFMMENLLIIKEKPVGDEKNHFWALLNDGKRTFGTIGFFLYEKYEAMGKPKRIDVAFFPDLNEYPKGSGKVSVQLKLEDLRPAKKQKYKKKKSG